MASKFSNVLIKFQNFFLKYIFQTVNNIEFQCVGYTLLKLTETVKQNQQNNKQSSTQKRKNYMQTELQPSSTIVRG